MKTVKTLTGLTASHDNGMALWLTASEITCNKKLNAYKSRDGASDFTEGPLDPA